MHQQKNEPRSHRPVFAIIDRADGTKPYWQRIGAAFENRDGSTSILLNAVPLTGKLQIRDAEEKYNGYRKAS